jgi:phytoene synthase
MTILPDDNAELDFERDINFGDILANPILDIAARFWDNGRYQAFRVCYRSMRLIDDLVDHRKSFAERISRAEKEQLKRTITGWLEAVSNGDRSDEFTRRFVDVLEEYTIPFWPWEQLCLSMIYDLEHDGYSDLSTFIRYSEGAAVAPASVFMHLCGISNANGSFQTPDFDVRKTARPLALFCYLVHIIRDFQKDHLSNLNYFADDLLSRYSLARKDLRRIAVGGAISQSFRDLIAAYLSIAERYRAEARRAIDKVLPMLQPKYQLSLEVIYQLYLQVFEKIDPGHGRFTRSELNPTSEEVRIRIERTAYDFVPVS